MLTSVDLSWSKLKATGSAVEPFKVFLEDSSDLLYGSSWVF